MSELKTPPRHRILYVTSKTSWFVTHDEDFGTYNWTTSYEKAWEFGSLYEVDHVVGTIMDDHPELRPSCFHTQEVKEVTGGKWVGPAKPWSPFKLYNTKCEFDVEAELRDAFCKEMVNELDKQLLSAMGVPEEYLREANETAAEQDYDRAMSIIK